MCLLLLAIDVHPAYKLILAGNRDEYYDRPTAPVSFWEEEPDVLAGKDLRSGGTWMGITKKGRIAAITNYRDPGSKKEDAPSRGLLVKDFLLGAELSTNKYLEKLRKRSHHYNGFNLVLGKIDQLYWYCNRADEIRRLEPGIYGLSNHLLDTPWPKVEKGKEGLRETLNKQDDPDPEEIFRLLYDRTVPHDGLLPDTGVGLEWERILAPIFITSPVYGTRSSSIVYIDRKDRVTFLEINHDEGPEKGRILRYTFKLDRKNPGGLRGG